MIIWKYIIFLLQFVNGNLVIFMLVYAFCYFKQKPGHYVFKFSSNEMFKALIESRM